jgi:UDP-glucose 4-epimerase
MLYSDYMKNKKVLITGGLGFIGSHLVEELSKDNQVVVIDNESSGDVKNIEHLDLESISLDLGDINSVNLNDLLEDVNYVFHLAALASVPRSVADPLLCNHVNVTGTLKLLSAACKNEVEKFVFSSSSAIYGDSKVLPLSEKVPPNPKSPYAASKVAGELYCHIFNEVYGLSTVSLRYFNVYGPRQDPNSQYAAAIPKFMNAFVKGGIPIIYGDGEQTRDFVYVKDVVKANIHFCQSNETGEFQIGSGKSIRINQLFEIMKTLFNSDSKPVYQEPRPGDIKHSSADISKAINAGFRPDTDFVEGLSATVDSMKI